ncbi:MAG: aspartate kinase [Enterobacterales bacterium]|nr:aspartate kinase [Enterobacterales bacterium]
MLNSKLKDNPNHAADKPWILMKFGGSSVSEPKHWETISKQVQSQLQQGNRPLIVLSALKNVSNLLESLLHQALAGVYSNAIFHLKEFHFNLASKLTINAAEQLEPWFHQLESNCQAIFQQQRISPKMHASVLAIGELLSSTIGAIYLNQSDELSSCWIDARQLLKSHHSADFDDDSWHHYMSAECRYRYDDSLCKKLARLAENNSALVTQGFIASDRNHSTVLLGREGSDTSAAYLAAKIGAKEIQIWTDVPGVFSCNPQNNPKAKQLQQLHYLEAMQMAKMGAKVLHPRAIDPAQRHSIPIRVKSTQLPSEKGTIINSTVSKRTKMKAVVSETKVLAVSITGVSDIPEAQENHPYLKTLSSIGFDLLLQSDIENQEQKIWVLKYTNSDIQEPSIRQIQALLDSCNTDNTGQVSFRNNLSIISIIGRPNCLDWLDSVSNNLERHIVSLDKKLEDNVASTQDFCYQLLKKPTSGLVSLLVARDNCLALEAMLHHDIIDSVESAQYFGQDWLCFFK